MRQPGVEVQFLKYIVIIILSCQAIMSDMPQLEVWAESAFPGTIALLAVQHFWGHRDLLETQHTLLSIQQLEGCMQLISGPEQ